MARYYLGGLRPGKDWKQWVMTMAYSEAIRKAKADVVLAEFGHFGALVMDACERMRVPLVVHFHGIDAHGHDLVNEHRDAYQRLFRIARRIVVVSEPMKRQLESLGAPEGKIHKVTYGVDVDQFVENDVFGAEPTFTFVGRFVEKKAPHLTILAFAEVVKRHPECKLQMVGEGPLLSVCKDLAEHLGIQERVMFEGKKSHAEIAEVMQASFAFVQHSVTAANGDQEGTPNSILEASSCGLPVVATKHAGIPEVILDSETGFLVDEHDVNGMAVRMMELVENRERAAAMGKAGRQRIESHFRLKHQIDKLHGILQLAAEEVG